MTSLENALRDQALNPEIIQKHITDQLDSVKWKGGDGFSDTYIRQLALVHLGDTITEAWKAAKGGAV